MGKKSMALNNLLRLNSLTCQVCGDLEPIDDANIESSFNAVRDSADKGCESCILLRQTVVDCVPEVIVQDDPSPVYVVVRRSILRNFIEIAVRRVRPAKTVIVDIFVPPGTYCPWPSIRVGIETSGNTISAGSFDRVDKWLTKCIQDHSSCRSGVRSTLPSRVLDLMAVEPNVVLCEPQGKDTKYVCLSHCWGNARGLTTTNENVSAFQDSISFIELPRTFQEAVIFTRKLGVRYLWIDSLCIIQDDEDDWQKESAMMAHIYRNSYLTLAATGSDSDHGGLFSKHPKTKINGTFRDGHDYEIHARPVIDHMDEAQFPLFKRGWVFQERLLAPRVLHFGRQELWWECLERVDCECTGIFGDRYGTGQEKFLSKLTHQEALSNSDLPSVCRRWHAIVEEFSQLGLTMSRDKLPALSGIAEQIQHLRQGTYLAGLWSDALVPDLLWYRIDLSTSSHPARWRGPTWSWAALDGPIRYFDAPNYVESPEAIGNETATQLLTSDFLETVEGTSRVAGENPFGEVKSAHLVLRGRLMPIHVFDARTMSSRTSTSLGMAPRNRRRPTKLKSNSYEFRFERRDDPISYSFFADFDLQGKDPGFTRLKYALLQAVQDSHGDEFALVLKCIEPSQNIYERIGLFTTKFSRWRTTGHHELYKSSFESIDRPSEIMLV